MPPPRRASGRACSLAWSGRCHHSPALGGGVSGDGLPQRDGGVVAGKDDAVVGGHWKIIPVSSGAAVWVKRRNA